MKKGQGAMDFIMSYGWAVLLLLIILAAFGYFGGVDTEEFFFGCQFPPGISCNEMTITNTGLTLVLKNDFGQDITITQIKDTQGKCATTGSELDNTATASYSLSACEHSASGTNYKSDIVIDYTSSIGINHTIKGEISGKIV